MKTVGRYQVNELLHRGRRTLVYRGRRSADGATVVIKTHRSGTAGHEDQDRLRREYELLKSFSNTHIVHPVDFVEEQHVSALVLSDDGARSLREARADLPLPAVDVLDIAIDITSALKDVHAVGIIHKDIKPENILVDGPSGRYVLADFSIAAPSSVELSERNLDVIDGTLAYMSPEQTGRMNCAIDHRSDFYSLGITLYELLAGRLPFLATDPMELVYCHLAKVPLSLTKRVPTVPGMFARIVDKLLEKTADRRYQTARGLLADLERCRDELRTKGTITEFPLGLHDLSPRFQIPDKLYGRSHEVSGILGAFERARGGRCELVLVTGPSGAGKSALIDEVSHKIRMSCTIIRGKSDPFNRETPFAALLQALAGFARHLLTEEERQLHAWKQRIGDALGERAQVLVDVVPELELLVGRQPSVPPLPPRDAANRFQAVLRRLLQAISPPQHPLVVVLDDLHWSDVATLKLMETLLPDPELSHQLWIASYRAEEIRTDGPLAQAMETIAMSVPVECVELEPLSSHDTHEFVCATVMPTQKDTAALTDYIHFKTAGNPFFVRAFLQSLHLQGLFEFRPLAGGWVWDLDDVRRASVTDDVGELMSRRIDELSADAQHALTVAACFGDTFAIEELAPLVDRTPQQVRGSLRDAVVTGLIRGLDGSSDGASVYQFSHDRVLQAAYACNTPARRKQIHREIGRHMLDTLRPSEVEEQIFVVVHHLNLGIANLHAQEERRRLAGLNLRAGVKAKLASAHDSAVQYLRQGLALLPENGWEVCPQLAADLHREGMEAEYLNGDHDAAIALYHPLSIHVKSTLDRVDLASRKVLLDTDRGFHKQAINVACEGLALLGMQIPHVGTNRALLKSFAGLQWRLLRTSVNEIRALPAMTDAHKQAALHLLMTMTAPAFFVDRKLVSIIQITIASLTLDEGLGDNAGYGFAGYGMILAGGMRQYRRAYQYGQLALDLVQGRQNPAIVPKVVFLVTSFVKPWICPIADVMPELEDGYHAALHNGDLAYAGYIAANRVFLSIVAGRSLSATLELVDGFGGLAQRSAVAELIGILAVARRCCSALFGEGSSAAELTEEVLFADIDLTQAPNVRPYGLLYQAMVLYHVGGEASVPTVHEIAYALMSRVEETFVTPAFVDAFFLVGLTSAELLRRVGAERAKELRKRLRHSLRRLRGWSRSCPANFEARYLLVQGQQARMEGNPQRAMWLFQHAVDSAQQADNRRLMALGNELTARQLFERDMGAVARQQLEQAATWFRRWGAPGKSKALASDVGQHNRRSVVQTSTTAKSNPTDTFDLHTVIKVSQAISREIRLDELLRLLVRFVMENAGARKAFLLLEDGGSLRIEAEGRADTETVEVLQSEPLSESAGVSSWIVNYVVRTRTAVVLDDAASTGAFTGDPYIASQRVRSVLCTPVIHHGEILGALYLENDLMTGAFTSERLGILEQLAAQTAISITNARLYHVLEQARTEAVVAERIKTRFLLYMSRELRTPLNDILAQANRLRGVVEEEDPIVLKSALEWIRASSKRLLWTLTSILELSKLEVDRAGPDVSRCDVSELVYAVIAEVEDTARQSGTSMIVECASGLGDVLTNRAMLRYSLLTVLDNACRFTRHGSVTLRGERLSLDGSADTWIQFHISDTGVGIAPSVMARLFEVRESPITSEGSARVGGVSLAVSRRFCRILGGELILSSEVGVGTNVTIRLPDRMGGA